MEIFGIQTHAKQCLRKNTAVKNPYYTVAGETRIFYPSNIITDFIFQYKYYN